jgi:hypothetical protein
MRLSLPAHTLHLMRSRRYALKLGSSERANLGHDAVALQEITEVEKDFGEY